MGRSVPRSLGWIGLTALMAAAGCQAILGLEEGKPLPAGTGGETTTTTTPTTSSGGGEGGMAGAGGGSGGMGGLGSGGGGGGPTCMVDGSQNGDETGVDCGGSSCAPCPLLLLLGGGGATVLGGAYHPMSGWSTATVAGGSAASRPALAWSSAGEAVGLIHGTGDALEFTTWRQPNAWTDLAAVPNAASGTRSAPGLSSATAGVIAVYQQPADYHHRYAGFAAGTWNPVAEPLGADESFGPSEADIAADGADAVAAFINGKSGQNLNDLFVRRRTGGVWQAEQLIATDTDFDRPPPRIVTLANGAGLLVVYVLDNSTQLRFTRWNGSAWSAPASITGCSTDTRPALAPLATSGAVLGFRGTDGKLYAAIYDGTTWSAPSGVPGPAADIIAPPAVAPGVGGGVDAELVYLTAGGGAYHVRRSAGLWGQPSPIVMSSTMTQVTLASAPP